MCLFHRVQAKLCLAMFLGFAGWQYFTLHIFSQQSLRTRTTHFGHVLNVNSSECQINQILVVFCFNFNQFNFVIIFNLWCVFNMELLIELVKQYLCLWNTKSTDYRGQTRKDNVQQEIGNTLEGDCISHNNLFMNLISCLLYTSRCV